MKYHLLLHSLLILALPYAQAHAAEDLIVATNASTNQTQEPSFPEIQFFALDPPKTMQQRVQSVLYGITIDLPPQYDHYGYDIRRYMTSVGSAEVLDNHERIAEELQKVEHAQKILEAWKQKNVELVAQVQQEVEQEDVDPVLKQDFNLNRSKAAAFFIDAKIWLDNHRKMLEQLSHLRGEYYFEDSQLTFKNPEDMRKFAAAYEESLISIQAMHEYVPFRVMVY